MAESTTKREATNRPVSGATASTGPAREELFDLAHAPVLACFAELVRSLGGDLVVIGEKAGGLPPAEGPERQAITYRLAARLLAVAAEELDYPDFGMRLAAMQNRLGVEGALGRTVRSSPTYGAALATIARYGYAHSLAVASRLLRSEEEGGVRLSCDILLSSSPDKRQLLEQILLNSHLTACRLTGDMVRARRVDFRHEAVSGREVYRRNFGCEVRFGQQDNAIHFHETDLDCPVVTADEVAFRQSIAAIEAGFPEKVPPTSAQARGVIVHFLGTDRCSIARVAQVLGLHPRTMHRRLSAEGTSFRGLLDDARRDALLYYLRHTEIDMSGISERLGFSEQSVMTRCCQRWFGKPPRRLRQDLQ